MRVLPNSKPFDFERLEKDLVDLDVPTDFDIIIKDPISSYWGLYHSGKQLLKSYVAGLPYEDAFPHILHESLHHYQHRHQDGFRRMHGVMHDSVFNELYESKMNMWTSLYKDRR